MPRVNGVYQLLPGVYGVPNEPIASTPYNSQLDDLAKDANDPRPVTAGGTGAQTPGDALTNFGFSAFVKSLLGKASDVLFRTAIGADDATNLTKGTLPAGRISDASHGQLSGGNLHAAATGSTHGFMSPADKTKLDGLIEKNLTGWVSGRDFTNGTLITTSIPAAASDGEAFLIEIVGNSYGSSVPFDIKIQGYLYGNAIINHGALSTGKKPTEIWLFNAGGFLCCWLPYMEYWQGFTVFASIVGYSATDRPARNVVTAITNSAKPAGRTKEVSVPITQAALSSGAAFTGPLDILVPSGKALQAMTNGADYALFGRSLNSGYGGVLGYNYNATKYGILGYASDYSFYGSGVIYNAGEIRSSTNIVSDGYLWAKNGQVYGSASSLVLGTNGSGGYVYLRPNGVGSSSGEFLVTPGGSVQAVGHVYSGSGAAFLHTAGDVYGPTWGGYLSTYLGRFPNLYLGSDYNELYFPVGHTIMCDAAGNPARNGGTSPRLGGDSTLYSGGGSGSYLAGSWRSRGRVDTSTGSCLLQRVA